MVKCCLKREMEVRRKEVGIEFAGFWVRLGALLIDVIVLGLVGAALHILTPVPAIWAVLCLVGSFYFVGLWWWRGQTLGKILMGIKVVRSNGSSLTLGYAFLRYFGVIVCFLTLFIGFIWLAFDSHKQGWHDKIADTYVIKLHLKEVVLVQNYA